VAKLGPMVESHLGQCLHQWDVMSQDAHER
jgi:hypothetical protein